jgi:hypothetical protein
MCLRFQFCTHQRVSILYFLKKSQIRCTLLYRLRALVDVNGVKYFSFKILQNCTMALHGHSLRVRGRVLFSLKKIRTCRMALHGQSLEILEIGEDDTYYLISKLCNSSGGCCMIGVCQDLPKKTAP